MASDDASWLEEHQGLVVSIAEDIADRYRLQRFMDDLVAFGQEGLVEAHSRFDESKGTSFSTFAWYHVRGRIIDGCRSMGVLTRRQGETVRVEQAIYERQAERAERASDGAERPRSIGHIAEDLDEMIVDAATILMMNESGARSAPAPTPERQVERWDTAAFVRREVEKLDDDDRRILQMSYFDGKTLDDIAEVFGCSKSWASRMRRAALNRLGDRISREDGLP